MRIKNLFAIFAGITLCVSFGTAFGGTVMVHAGGSDSAKAAEAITKPAADRLPLRYFSLAVGSEITGGSRRRFAYRLPSTSEIRNLHIWVSANTYDAPATIGLWINGEPTALLTKIEAGNTDSVDIEGVVEAQAGDEIEIRGDKSDTTKGWLSLTVSYEIDDMQVDDRDETAEDGDEDDLEDLESLKLRLTELEEQMQALVVQMDTAGEE